METVSRASITDSVCRPGQYRREVPQMLSRSAVRLRDRQFAPRTLNYTVGDHPQDEFITIQASKKDKHTDRKEQEEKEEGDRLNNIDEEIREMDRRLTQMRQQGFYPIDASIKVIESEDTEKRGISQMRPSFLTDSFEEVKENTQLKTQTFLAQKTFRQRLETPPPPVEKDNYTESKKRRVMQYPEEERKSHFPPPVESPIYAKRSEYLKQQNTESNGQRIPLHDSFEEDNTDQPLFSVQRKRDEDNLRAWEENIKRKETELKEREEQITLQERRKQQANTHELRRKEEELKRRMELLQIHKDQLSQREAGLRRSSYGIHHREIKEEIPEENYQREDISERESLGDSVHRTIRYNTDIKILRPNRKPEHPIEKVKQDSAKGNDKQKVLDTQYLFPKFSPFSGEDPKPKAEATYEAWRYEVNCTRESGDYSESMIAQAFRKSLRNPAKKVLLPLGTTADVDTIMDKLDGVFGNVAKGQSVLKEFYTAAQMESETVTA